MVCRKTQFSDETSVKISTEVAPCNCGGDVEVPVISATLVRYNGEYCHIGSVDFNAKPTGLYPPCLPDKVPEPQIPLPPPPDPTVPPPVIIPPVSNPPPPPQTPVDEPPPVIPPETPDPITIPSEPDTTPDPDPPPVTPPPVVVPPKTFRFARGVFYNTSSWLGREPMPDFQQSSRSLLSYLNQARILKARCSFKVFRGYSYQKTILGDPELNASHALYDPTAVVGGFSLRRAKDEIAFAQGANPDLRSFVSDGSLISIMLLDDHEYAPAWNNRRPTGVEIDALAAFCKGTTGWSTVPTCVRGTANYTKSIKPTLGYKNLDFIWQQIDWGTPPPIVDPFTFFKNALATAQGIKLGLMYGGNLGDGGAGGAYTGGWNIRPSIQTKFGMSPTEIRRLADALVALGHNKGLGVYFWTDRFYYPSGGTAAQQTAYFLRSDIQAAFAYLKTAVKDLSPGPINYR